MKIFARFSSRSHAACQSNEGRARVKTADYYFRVKRERAWSMTMCVEQQGDGNLFAENRADFQAFRRWKYSWRNVHPVSIEQSQ